MEKVIIYSSSTCKVCKKAKEWFKSENISFEERNIDKNREYIDFLIENDFRGVPVIVIGDKKFLGFKEEEIREALK